MSPHRHRNIETLWCATPKRLHRHCSNPLKLRCSENTRYNLLCAGPESVTQVQTWVDVQVGLVPITQLFVSQPPLSLQCSAKAATVTKNTGMLKLQNTKHYISFGFVAFKYGSILTFTTLWAIFFCCCCCCCCCCWNCDMTFYLLLFFYFLFFILFLFLIFVEIVIWRFIAWNVKSCFLGK